MFFRSEHFSVVNILSFAQFTWSIYKYKSVRFCQKNIADQQSDEVILGIGYNFDDIALCVLQTRGKS